MPRSAEPLKPETQLGRADWVRAATRAMRGGGVEAIRVEPLARELGVTKGSFYWHFRDRADLLEAVLAWWESETAWLVAEAERAGTPETRLVRFFELVAEVRDYPPDAEIFAWARREPEVAARTVATESKRLAFVRAQLETAGLGRRDAERAAAVAYAATQGFIERISRGAATYASLPEFTRQLFAMVMDGTNGGDAE